MKNVNLLNEELDLPGISVLLPVYNGGFTLINAIESILDQTYKNFELIIIDDGSTDNSIEILHHYQSLDTRIILVTRENKGLVTTLNESLSLARAPWVARMDQDDISLPERFEKQLRWLELSGADICGSWIKYFGADNYICKYYESDEAIKLDMLFKSPFAHPSVMMRSNVIKKLSYDISCEKAEDYDLWVRAAQAGLKMGNIQEVLLKYRRHETQITSKSVKITQEVSAKIRERHWRQAEKLYRISEDDSQQAQKFILSDVTTNLYSANIAFSLLLNRSFGESNRALFDNIIRLYIKGAAYIKDIDKNWLNLTSKHKIKRSYIIQFKLYIISILKLKKESRIYFHLNNFYKKISN